MHDDDGAEGIQGGGGISGIGYVSGVRCIVSANDSAIKGGTSTPMGVNKHLRIQEIAMANKLPMVRLVESGGANLLFQAEMFVEGGRGFANQARLSAAGIPQVTVVHGSSTAGGAYLPGLSDYAILVRGRAKVFLAGPPLLRAATGEIATMKSRRRRDACDRFRARRVSGRGRCRRHSHCARNHGQAALERAASRATAKILQGAALRGGGLTAWCRPTTASPTTCARSSPASSTIPIISISRPSTGPHTVCGQAEIEGHAIGLIGNNGPIDADGAAKAAQFIQLCGQANMPIVYLQNTTGYMVGREAEQAGIIKHGSKMIQAVANATVPQLTVHVGASFGAGNYGMCGRAYDPRFIFAWPSNRIAVMGGEQAAKVMAIVTEEKL